MNILSQLSVVVVGGLILGLSVQGAQLQPEWGSIELHEQGEIELEFTAPLKQMYVIEASDDLKDWKVVSDPIEATGKTTHWVAPRSEEDQLFYRLSLFDRDWMRSQFERSRRLWNEKALSDYQYVFNWSCFCLPEYTAPVNIEVEQGEWADIFFVDTGIPVSEENWQRYETIDDLFDIIDDAFQQDAKAIHASYDPDLGYPTSVFIDYSELIADEERGFNVDLQEQASIQFVAQNPEEVMSDPFRLLDAKLNGDLLELQVEYGGGCRVHQFELFSNPVAFLESEPVQANVYLSHENHHDLCKALVRKKVAFSLQPLKKAFRELYPSRDSFVLNIRGIPISDGAVVLNLIYEVNE